MADPPRPRPQLPAPRQPSFGTRRPARAIGRWLAAGAAAAAVLGLCAAYGLWFAPFVAGIVAGVGRWRTGRALALAVAAVLVGWGAALWWPTLSGAPVGATARVVAALAGLPAYAWVGVAGTLLIGVLQVLVAYWLARAVSSGRRASPDARPGG